MSSFPWLNQLKQLSKGLNLLPKKIEESEGAPRTSFLIPKMVFPDRETASLFNYKTKDEVDAMTPEEQEAYRQKVMDRKDYVNKIQNKHKAVELVEDQIRILGGGK